MTTPKNLWLVQWWDGRTWNNIDVTTTRRCARTSARDIRGAGKKRHTRIRQYWLLDLLGETRKDRDGR